MLVMDLPEESITFDPVFLHDASVVFKALPTSFKPHPAETPIIAIDPGEKVTAHVIRLLHNDPSPWILNTHMNLTTWVKGLR